MPLYFFVPSTNLNKKIYFYKLMLKTRKQVNLIFRNHKPLETNVFLVLLF